MRTKRYLPGKLLLLLMATALLGSCAKETMDSGQPLPEGKYPVEFTSTAYRLDVMTRATTNDTWDGGEEVAIKIGSEVKKYVADSHGNLTAAAGVTPFCWASTGETKLVTAWYPYSASQPSSFGVPKNQIILENHQKSDLIMACRNISFGDKDKKLTFQHLTAKVTVNITGNNISDLSGATVTLINIGNTIMNIAAQPGSITTGYTSGNGTSTPYVVSASANQVTVQALLPPVTLSKFVTKPFVQVVLDGNTYYYTHPTVNDNLDGGKAYTFNITVQGKPTVPLYAIGDPYPDATNPIGVVFWLDTTDPNYNPATLKGSKGKIVSLDEMKGTWGCYSYNNNTSPEGASDPDYGAQNTKKVIDNMLTPGNLPDDGSINIYVSFNWIYNTKNNKDINGRWYLPARNELLLQLYPNKSVVEATLIKIAGAITLSEKAYWSSTESSSDPEAFAMYLDENGTIQNNDKQGETAIFGRAISTF